MKKLIVRIAEGLGNQLFMYSNGFALSKKNNCNFYIDNTSGYFKKKNQFRSFELDKLSISSEYITSDLKYDNYFLDCKRKIKKKLDFFKHKKSFLIESKDIKKNTSYKKVDLSYFSDLIFVEGFYQSEKYFVNYRNNLINEFKIKKSYIDVDNFLIDELKKNESVSICIRQNRFSEGQVTDDNKSLKFTHDTIEYIKSAVLILKKKVNNPKFYIWSDDFSNLREYFDEDEFTFIENANNKFLNDFYLFQYSKHFIVGPTSFHWWGAWLNENPNKICVRPSNINPSNNIDYWPSNWISI
ncbi:alpha-1,2-fucosyltransferase [Candidatus Pelagibacter sp.]|nr:alpha-1,2-fucosyltransferase [Candidatus Pelagibacter sp.]